MTEPATLAREYLRVSLDRSGRERSQDEQHDDNHRTAQSHGWRLGRPYRENGSASASRYATTTRDAFGKLLEDLRRNRFGAGMLILWESSRGSRRVSEWVTLIELCEARGVQIYITADAKLYDPANPRDRRSLLEDSIDSEFESAKISKRAKRASAAGARDGRPHGRVPFGYRRRYDPATRRLVAQEPEPAEATVVRELFDRLHRGHSLRSIAADFERRGIRTRTGLVFSAQHLRSLAVTRAYVGERVHDPGRGTGGPKLSERAVVTPAAWPALVDRRVFLAVQRTLTAPERVTTRPGRAVHLMSMIAVCDPCGGPLAARGHDRGPQYVCHRKGCVRIDYEGLNALCEAVILATLSAPDNAPRLLADDRHDEQLAAVREEIAGIRSELDDLADRLGRGEVSATLAARAEPKILARIRDAQARETELATPETLRGLISPGADVRRRWKKMPMAAKRQVARILFTPERIGEVRVMRSPTPGHACPVEDRVIRRTS